MPKEFDIDRKELEDHIENYDMWPEILAALGGLTEATRTIGKGKHHDCPFPQRHSQKSGGRKKMRLTRKRDNSKSVVFTCTCGHISNPFTLLMEINGWSFPDVLEEVNRYCGDPCNAEEKRKLRGTPEDHEQRERLRKKAEAERAVREAEAKKRHQEEAKETARRDAFFVDLLAKVWTEGVAVTDPVARPLWLYLQNRGINPRVLTMCKDQKFHPSCEYYSNDGEILGEYPCLLSAFKDKTGRPVTIHRIYLTPDGLKASFGEDESTKKLMPYPSFVDPLGGAIQLVEPNPELRVLGVGEGIETVWAAISATGIPAWPCYSDWYLANFDFEAIRNETDFLIIWADKDRSLAGEKAAKKLKKRCLEAGLACQIMLPPFAIPDGEKSIDWNDVLRTYGREAFPQPNLDLILQVQSSQLNQSA